jgi:hypothetical protein
MNRRINTIVDTLIPLGYDFIHVTGPCDIAGTAYMVARQHDYEESDEERSWWWTDDANRCHTGIEDAFALWGQAIQEHGPIAGVLGFSQGGCAGASIAAMLEPSRRDHPLVKKYMPSWQPPLEFLIMFSGNPYRYPDETVHWLFFPEGGEHNLIRTRTLAFYGQKEWDREKSQRERQQWFIKRLANVKVVAHPWKHTVPRTQEYADVVKDFILEGGKDLDKPQPRL